MAEGEKERLRVWMEGLVGAVRKAREEGWAWGGEVAVVVVGGDRRVERWDIRAVLRAWVLRRARLSLRVSWSLRRRRRMDSGVGAVGERGSSRVCEGDSGVSSIRSLFVCPRYHAKLGISV